MLRRLLALACLVLVLAGCSLPRRAAPSGDAVVYVVDRGWHTDIGLPVATIAGPLAVMAARFPGLRTLTFGFGERQFLLTRQTTFVGMLTALLPSPSALLITALRTSPQEAFGPRNVVVLHVSSAGLERIEARLWRDFQLSAADEPVSLADGPYPGSVFYAARGTYDGFFTCNTWTSETLRSGGLPMPTAGVLFSGQVMGLARWISASQGTSSRN